MTESRDDSSRRIIELSGVPSYVSVENGLLTLDIQESDCQRNRHQFPPQDIAAIVAAHYAVTFTRESLALLADHGAQVVVCNKRGMPAGMILPIGGQAGFHQPASRLALQAAMGRPITKRLWKQIIRNKVQAQGALLTKLTGEDGGLLSMSLEVKAGDTTNVEGLAARIYWQQLFGRDFRRDPDGFDHNRHLNYGYGILRAVVARAICAAGLHPGLGLQHHHRANAFCLADDLMEPFRPLVDEIVVRLWRQGQGMMDLSPAIKKQLLGVVTRSIVLERESRGLFDTVSKLCLSLAAVIEKRRKGLLLPAWKRQETPEEGP